MSDSIEKTQQRIKAAVNSIIDELDKKYLRDMQRVMFNCSSRCCEDKVDSRDAVERCVDLCNLPMKKAQAKLEDELNALQSQLSRCSMTCYDKQVQKFGPDSTKYTEDQLSKFSKSLDVCVDSCATDHINLLPLIKDRFAKSLK